MLGSILLFLLGAFVAAFVTLCIMPLVWMRAVRVTEHRIEAAIPLNMQEMQAERDQMRAQHAITVRTIEMQRDKVREKISASRLAISHQQRKNDAMDIELASKTAALNNEKLIKARVQAELKSEKTQTRKLTSILGEARNEIKQNELDIAALKQEKSSLSKELEVDRKELRSAAREVERQRLAMMDLEDLVERRERDIARLKGVSYETVSTKSDVVAKVVGDDKAKPSEPTISKDPIIADEEKLMESPKTADNQDLNPSHSAAHDSDIQQSLVEFEADLAGTNIAALANGKASDIRERMIIIAQRIVSSAQQQKEAEQLEEEIGLPSVDEIISDIDKNTQILQEQSEPSVTKGGLSSRLSALREADVAE